MKQAHREEPAQRIADLVAEKWELEGRVKEMEYAYQEVSGIAKKWIAKSQVLEAALRDIQIQVLGEGGIPHELSKINSGIISKLIDLTLSSPAQAPERKPECPEPDCCDGYGHGGAGQ